MKSENCESFAILCSTSTKPLRSGRYAGLKAELRPRRSRVSRAAAERYSPRSHQSVNGAAGVGSRTGQYWYPHSAAMTVGSAKVEYSASLAARHDGGLKQA
ncbi:hypothetical protein AAW51_0585 [Caldimonas brevitalea]|uniref:Uncharacterized protein n=1 Tax=Caldimonas brevitalea TaxID=413882 RepID=A0A0G3BIU5_9BURK|nr:hypothetical protein AAW51_0585 [Caldimonas brevitalea]